MTINCDSYEYDIFHQVVPMIKNVPGMTLELGVRQGGGSAIIIEDLMLNGIFGRTHICLDPYGHIPYETSDEVVCRYDYTNQMRNQCIQDMYAFIAGKPVNLLFFVMTDSRYFEYFKDGVPIYDTEEKMETQYALVHFDGPHSTEAVTREMEFFHDRTPVGGVWVFDDILEYKHDEIVEKWVFERGYQLVRKGQRKAAYVKR